MLLPSLIDEAQAAFIPGQNISNNIFLAQELFRNYHRVVTGAHCAIKVDLLKAYDMVRWSFLIDLMRQMGFPSRFIEWIQECITTPKYSININGELVGFFGASRGLRQGDPLSPYLFVLIMEALSMLLKRKIEKIEKRGDSLTFTGDAKK